MQFTALVQWFKGTHEIIPGARDGVGRGINDGYQALALRVYTGKGGARCEGHGRRMWMWMEAIMVVALLQTSKIIFSVS